jgi:hypothetical protein
MPRRRIWHLPPDGFRELRRSCLLSRKACADLLGCSMSAVRAWDRGTHRVPWSAVKLLRLFRSGDLGALRTEWRGWTLNRNGLVSPEGFAYSRGDLGWWSLTCRQAEAFRQSHRKPATRPSGGDDTQAASNPTDGGRFAYEAVRRAHTALREALSPPKHAPAGCSGSAALRGGGGCMTAGHASGPQGCRAPARHPCGPGLVSSQKQVTREGQKASKNAACSGGAE